jgi:hypothetical protein
MALAVAASSARAADETKKSDAPAIHGVVTAVTADSFTIKPAVKKSADAAAPAAEPVTFAVTKDTKFAKMARRKKGDAAAPADDQGEAAAFADLKEGATVVSVEASKDGKTALSVKFREGRKPKKPAA